MSEVTVDSVFLNDLMERVRTLESTAMCGKKKHTYLAELIKVKPLSHPRTLESDKPIFGYTNYTGYDAWHLFRELARCLLEENPLFYMDSATDFGRRCQFIRSTKTTKPKDLRNVPEKDLEIAARMLDEMIAIYNRYFVETHRIVLYKPSPFEKEIQCEVCDPPESYLNA